MNRPIFLLEKQTGKYSFYGSLPVLLEDYPHLIDSDKNGKSYSNKVDYCFRKKKPYEDDKVTIFKGDLIRSKRR